MMKTLSLLVCVAAAPASALTSTADDQLTFFATCAGRLSATMEHQWIHNLSAVDATTAQRSEMINLVSAVMPDEDGRAVLNIRVSAKHAQAQLLARATLNRDVGDAEWAQARADALLQECTSVLLGSNAE